MVDAGDEPVFGKFILMEKTFENVPLSFPLHGKIINGILEGSSLVWTFSSADEAFLKLVPTGKLYNTARWVEPIQYEVQDMYNAICQAGEEKGFQLETPE